jgi:sec-independent protein translocase protein TatB
VIDFGFDKIALIGAVALMVIGPERLPKVARTVGHLMGKAQRYVADVKAEVNRSIELEELKKMKGEFETAARDVEQNAASAIYQASTDLSKNWEEREESSNDERSQNYDQYDTLLLPIPPYSNPNKRWRLKRGAMPQWYKQRHGIRGKAQSGAARVARFRPPSSSA